MDCEVIIGMPKEEAIALLDASHTSWRIVQEDGEVFAGTCDYNPGRYNLFISEGKVLGVRFG